MMKNLKTLLSKFNSLTWNDKAFYIIFIGGVTGVILGFGFCLIIIPLGDNELTRFLFRKAFALFGLSLVGAALLLFLTQVVLYNLQLKIKQKSLTGCLGYSIGGVFVLILLIGVFKICLFFPPNREISVYFGDGIYREFRYWEDGHSTVYNDGDIPFWVTVESKVKPAKYHNSSQFYKKFLYNDWGDSLVLESKMVSPGDSLLLTRSSTIVGHSKGIDSCRYAIPFNYIEYVGYYDKEGFHRKE